MFITGWKWKRSAVFLDEYYSKREAEVVVGETKKARAWRDGSEEVKEGTEERRGKETMPI